MSGERDYILGTHDEEIARLGLQHRVWRPRASDAWRRAGFGPGQTILDVGCGPGFASLDLAEIVGERGRVVALERSRRFLDTLEATARERGLRRITTYELDLDRDPIPVSGADAAWVRWVFAFVTKPRDLLERIAAALRPGGVLVAFEYVDYATWRFAPRSPALESFVEVVMESWRADGGEPDVGLDLPAWLRERGFDVRSTTPILDVIDPAQDLWQWPKTFVDVGVRRMVDLGKMTAAQGEETRKAFARVEAAPHPICVTPAVLEIIARKP